MGILYTLNCLKSFFNSRGAWSACSFINAYSTYLSRFLNFFPRDKRCFKSNILNCLKNCLLLDDIKKKKKKTCTLITRYLGEGASPTLEPCYSRHQRRRRVFQEGVWWLSRWTLHRPSKSFPSPIIILLCCRTLPDPTQLSGTWVSMSTSPYNYYSRFVYKPMPATCWSPLPHLLILHDISLVTCLISFFSFLLLAYITKTYRVLSAFKIIKKFINIGRDRMFCDMQRCNTLTQANS